MSRWADKAAREAKATDLEQIIVEMGDDTRRAFMESDAKAADTRKAALDVLSKRRGKRVTASEDTWALVQVFLLDRFVGRTT